MSMDTEFSFPPTTPPMFTFDEAADDTTFPLSHAHDIVGHDHGHGHRHVRSQIYSYGHSRAGSHVSNYSQDSSPDSINTALTTPSRSPIRQHGCLLLPKIRHKDQEIHSPPTRFKKTLSLPPNSIVRPAHSRSYTNPESLSFMTELRHSQDDFPSQPRQMSLLCSTVSFSKDSSERSASVSQLDDQTIEKYSFPTYRQLPTYIPSASNTHSEMLMSTNFYHMPKRTPSPLQHTIMPEDLCLSPLGDGNSTTLMSYLTSPNPAPALVRQLNVHVRDTNAKHFWWDVRQIRPWTSFSPATINAISGLHALLNVNLPASSLPVPSRTSSQPENELGLQNIYFAFYASKLNAALSTSLGHRHLVMRNISAKGNSEPSFISNYVDDTSQLIYGRGLGRVVGLVKSFDRWNTGMRVEGNHRKVEYLRGLAHLHRHMREHNCRYGFILTEIELVVVRNGTETVPHFGYLEVQTIQLAYHEMDTSTFEEVERSFGIAGEEDAPVKKQPKMTALLALWYLHMLARDDPLPGQVGWKSEIGAPAEGSRRKCLPKDVWIPEPQLAEKREAKRARGWIWPEESVGRKELGRRGVKYVRF